MCITVLQAQKNNEDKEVREAPRKGLCAYRLFTTTLFCDYVAMLSYLSTQKMVVSLYHRERILETSTLSCNEEEEEITKPPTR